MSLLLVMWEMIGVALGNAKDDVQKHADIVAPACIDDGVAVVLEQLGIVK